MIKTARNNTIDVPLQHNIGNYLYYYLINPVSSSISTVLILSHFSINKFKISICPLKEKRS
jgi:hypothetical protein